MTIDQNILVTITIIFSLTLIGVIALTRNTNTEVDIRLGGDKSVNIKNRRSLPENTKVDCLPGEDNSQPLNCGTE